MFDVSNLDFPNIMNLSFGTSKNFNKYKPRIKLKTFFTRSFGIVKSVENKVEK